MRWIGAALGVILIGVAVLLFAGWVPVLWTSQEHRDEVDASVVRMDLGSGDVTVRSGAVGQVELVARTRTWWLGDGEPDWRSERDVLVLGDCGRWCRVNYDLVVPPGTRFEGETGSGDVTVRGASGVDAGTGSGEMDIRDIAGDVVVKTGSGSIDVSDVDGAVRASTGSGEITLDRIDGPSAARTSSGSITGRELAGPVDASTSSGDVILGLIAGQNVRAETSSGDVELTVPAGRYRVDADSDTGEERIEVVDDPDAEHSLELQTSSGDITVRPR